MWIFGLKKYHLATLFGMAIMRHNYVSCFLVAPDPWKKEFHSTKFKSVQVEPSGLVFSFPLKKALLGENSNYS
jgi:hypothetical protein